MLLIPARYLTDLNKLKMAAVIVYGDGWFAATDRFEYMGETYYRRNHCCHICCVPIFPLGAMVVNTNSPNEGVKIGAEQPGNACCRAALYNSPLCLFGWPRMLFGECCPEHCIPPVPEGDKVQYINHLREATGLEPLGAGAPLTLTFVRCAGNGQLGIE